MNIFVGCSASEDIDKKYFTSSYDLLTKIMPNNNLVFGACNSGLMRIAYTTTKEIGNKVIGICPIRYKEDFKTLSCDEEIISNSTIERTNDLIKYSDVLLFLPGGIGTVSELYSSIESKRCHDHNKPIIIYNIDGFYDELLKFMEVIYQNNFAKERDKETYFVANNSREIINYLEEYKKKI